MSDDKNWYDATENKHWLGNPIFGQFIDSDTKISGKIHCVVPDHWTVNLGKYPVTVKLVDDRYVVSCVNPDDYQKIVDMLNREADISSISMTLTRKDDE